MNRNSLPEQNRLSKEYVSSLEAIRFCGEISVVSAHEEVEIACEELSSYNELGFDTESRPSFRKGISYPVSLVQLSTSSKSFLFQLNGNGLPKELVRIFSNPEIKKIGIGIKEDIKKLKEVELFDEKGFVDLGDIASEKGIIQFGARALSARYLGKKIVKSAQKTNWARRDLTEKQKIYAATDAWVCLQIYPILLADQTDYREYASLEEPVEDLNGD